MTVAEARSLYERASYQASIEARSYSISRDTRLAFEAALHEYQAVCVSSPLRSLNKQDRMMRRLSKIERAMSERGAVWARERGGWWRRRGHHVSHLDADATLF